MRPDLVIPSTCKTPCLFRQYAGPGQFSQCTVYLAKVQYGSVILMVLYGLNGTLYIYYVYDTCGSIGFYMILVHGISTRSWNRAPAKSLRLPADKGVPSSDGFPLSNQSSLQDKTCTDLHHLHHLHHSDHIDALMALMVACFQDVAVLACSDCFLFCTAMQ